jgi:hypothetical protein
VSLRATIRVLALLAVVAGYLIYDVTKGLNL